MLIWTKPKKGPPMSKITDRTAIQQTSPHRQTSKIPNHTKSLFFTKPTPISLLLDPIAPCCHAFCHALPATTCTPGDCTVYNRFATPRAQFRYFHREPKPTDTSSDTTRYSQSVPVGRSPGRSAGRTPISRNHTNWQPSVAINLSSTVTELVFR